MKGTLEVLTFFLLWKGNREYAVSLAYSNPLHMVCLFLIAHKLLLSVLISLSCFIYIYFASSHFDAPVLLNLKGGRRN